MSLANVICGVTWQSRQISLKLSTNGNAFLQIGVLIEGETKIEYIVWQNNLPHTFARNMFSFLRALLDIIIAIPSFYYVSLE